MNRVFPVSFYHWIKWVTHSAHHSRERKSSRSVWKRHFCLLSQTKNKTDTSWAVLSDESLKISQIFCTKALLYCDLYSLYRKTVHWPGWSKIMFIPTVEISMTVQLQSPNPFIRALLKFITGPCMLKWELTEWVTMWCFFLHLMQNLSVACHGLFWKTQKKC